VIILLTGLVEGPGGKGSAGAGKDLIANVMAEEYDFVKMSLADEIKRIAKRLWDFPDDALWGPSHLRNEPDERYPYKGSGKLQGEYLTPRFVLQTIGTEVGRLIDPTVWVRNVLNDATELLRYGGSYTSRGGYKQSSQKPPCGVVIPDGRFMNEVDAVRDAGGEAWRKRRYSPTLQGGAAAHPSELGLVDCPDDYFDQVIPEFESDDTSHICEYLYRLL
jgi:hypothetical protein